MGERVRKYSLITAGGFCVYLASVWLSMQDGLPPEMEFGCFFTAYLLVGNSIFRRIADNLAHKIFLDGNVLLVIATLGLFALGAYSDAVLVFLIFQIGSMMEMTVSDRVKAEAFCGAEQIREERTDSEKKVDRYAAVWTALMLIIAAVVVFLPRFLGGGYEQMQLVERSIVFLIAACPCALGMSVSPALLGGILRASKKGIVIRSSVSLEQLAKANTFLFDKTGTLTEAVFEVLEIHAEGMLQSELLQIASYLQSYSNELPESALPEYYGGEIVRECMTDIKELAGYGMRAFYRGQKIYLGSANLLKRKGISFEEVEKKKGTVVYVALDGEYAGYMVLSDTMKKDVKEMAKYLKRQCQASLIMVAGDLFFTGKETARTLRFDACYENQFLKDKLQRLEEFLQMQDDTEYLAAVGNGINDGPLLVKADVGIVMGTLASDAAIEAADIVLTDGEAMTLVDAVRIAKETVKIVRQNVLFTFLIKLAVSGLALGGMITGTNAMAVEVCVIGICMLNAIWVSKEPEE